MKAFGTVRAFDTDQGRGLIKPLAGGNNLPFERSAFNLDATATPPKTGQRLSYEVGTNGDKKPCAVNLQTI